MHSQWSHTEERFGTVSSQSSRSVSLLFNCLKGIINSFFFRFTGADSAYVTITDSPTNLLFEEYGNDTVKWVVRFEAYPKPDVIWSKNGDVNVIKRNPIKYKVKSEAQQTVLEISNIDLTDSGVYRVVIKVTGKEDRRNFTLRVKGKIINISSVFHQLIDYLF